MPNTTICLLLCLLSCHAVFSQSEIQDAEALLHQSIQQWEAGNFLASQQAVTSAFALPAGKKKKSMRAALNYQLARVELEFGYFAKADSLLNLAAKAFKKSPPDRARVLSMMGYSFLQQAKYAAADSLLALAATLQEKTPGKNHPDYATTLDWMGLSKFEQRKPAEAKPLYEKAKAIRYLHPGELSLDYAVSLDHLTEYYLEAEQADSAMLTCNDAIRIVGNHPYRNRLLNTLGRIYLLQGKYLEAIDTIDASQRLQENLGISNHPHYAKTLQNRGTAAQKLGRWSEAIAYLKRSSFHCEKSLGAHPDCAVTINNLGDLLANQDSTELEAADYFDRAADIFQKYGHVDRYLISKQNAATFLKDLGAYDRAIPLFRQIIASNEFEKYMTAYDKAYTLKNYAETLWYSGDTTLYEMGEDNIRRAEQIFLQNFSADNSAYLDFTSAIAEITELRKNGSISAVYYTRNFRQLIGMLRRNYPLMNEEERFDFFEYYPAYYTPFAKSWAKRNANAAPEINRALIEYQTAAKGASLQVNLNKQLWASSKEDSVLLHLSEEYRQVKKQLTAWQLNPPRGGVYPKDLVDSLGRLANNLERQMSRRSKQLDELFERVNREITFDTLRMGLGEKEALIDFMEVKYFDPLLQKNDGVWYSAMVCRKGYDAPVFIPLPKAQEVNALLTQSHPSANGSYIKSFPVNREVYTKIWQPFEAYLDGVERIYLSPEGALNQLAFHALYADTSGKTFLANKYDIRYQLSPGDILNHPAPPSNQTIVLMGGAVFDSLPPLPVDDALKVYREVVEDSSRGGSRFAYLPGSKSEVLKINELAARHHWRSDLETGSDASEQTFRNLCGQKCPGVIHLATHGKYFSRQPLKDTLHQPTLEEKLKNMNDPMARSVVALSGANVYWKSTDTTSVETDGILTALEISNMDLGGVELVVLSACETGLGDVQAQEGVFGLQRAFKLAGVKSVLVSLWQVPDRETAELMQAFYSYYFTGDTAADALRKAQTEMSKKYTPYCWAAFVLVE